MLLQKLLRIAKDSKLLERSIAYRNDLFSRKVINNRKLSAKVFATTPFTVMGLWGFVKQKDENETLVTTREILLAKADALFDQSQYKEIYDILSNYRDSRDVDILWRLGRALYNMSNTANEVEAKKMIYEGYDLICTALSIDESNWAAHKWMSILLNSKCSYEGMKARIQQLYNIKKHMLKASELNPKDATTFYMLGNWCYQVADLSWYQRKIASVIFSEPPTSSFEEALTYFENAEKIDPNFYSQNLLMLGKTYLKLNRKEEAVKYLKYASEYSAKNDEDHKAKQEAQKLLSSI